MKRWAVVLMVGLAACVQSPATPVPQQASAHTLVWSMPALDLIFELSRGMTNEIGLCGVGVTARDTTAILSMLFPGSGDATPTRVAMRNCPATAVLAWHNHPYAPFTAADSAEGLRYPSDLCRLGAQDIATAYKMRLPWVAVSVAVADSLWLCWWSREQVNATYRSGALLLLRVPRQGIIGSRERT